jgi:hypothetical protein
MLPPVGCLSIGVYLPWEIVICRLFSDILEFWNSRFSDIRKFWKQGIVGLVCGHALSAQYTDRGIFWLSKNLSMLPPVGCLSIDPYLPGEIQCIPNSWNHVSFRNNTGYTVGYTVSPRIHFLISTEFGYTVGYVVSIRRIPGVFSNIINSLNKRISKKTGYTVSPPGDRGQ